MKIAVFGADETSRGRLAEMLELALKAVAATRTFADLRTFVSCDVYQPRLSAGVTFTADDFHLRFLQSIQEKTESSDEVRIDERIRQTLNDSRLRYAVLYGSLNEQLATIVSAVRLLANTHELVGQSNITTRINQPDFETGSHASQSWCHACEACDDPQSERRLLSDLISRHSKMTLVS